jgi:hypothetical protein
MKYLITVSLIVLLLAACGPKVNDPYEPITSGVKGQALIGPMCPVMREGNPCPDQPYQTTLVVLTLDGQEVTRIQTDAEGKFQINLPPGDYVLHPEKPANLPVPTAPDIPFTVVPDGFTNIIVTYDSGIR